MNLEIASRDTQRINDLKLVQSALQLYFNKCGYYPGPVNSGGACGLYVANNTWARLSAALIGSGLGVSSVPNDPIGVNTYFYSTNVAGSSYVLGAQLEDPNNSALTQSPKGSVYGIDCATRGRYCVRQ